jgi:queuine tRNA-ribosyltransferase
MPPTRATHSFDLLEKDASTAARRGVLRLSHADVATPVFMPVGTQATVKTLSSEDLETLGYDLILANTYHLYLRPGMDVLEEAGGLHAFMGWKRGILTDSGGFQVFSLAERCRISEEGAAFASHVDGRRHVLTPESVVESQRRMGVDVAMCLDECPPYPVSEAAARDMMERTLRWADRSWTAWRAGAVEETRPRPWLFPIVQGATYPDLRRESARRTLERDWPGYAVGGLSVGEPRDIFLEMLEASVSVLPPDRPRYLMGVGKPPDILEAVARGVDMFDCVLPTRNGRNGQALTWQGPRNLRNARYQKDPDPIDPACACPACGRYSRQYLSHLFRAGEQLALRLVSLHNLAFMIDFMRHIQKSIERAEFHEFKTRFFRQYQPENHDA